MANWKMPDWMAQYEPLISDAGPDGVAATMDRYKSASAALLATDEGRALAVNAQVGLLVGLHAAGLLQEPQQCPLEGQAGSPPETP